MAIFRGSKIRGEQIQDRSVQGSNILQQSLTDEHIAPGAAISESKLNIDWHAHNEVLQDKKIVDFVQVNGIVASGTGIMDLETQIPGLVGAVKASSSNSVEGVITDAPKNAVPFRDAVTGEPLVAAIEGIEYEVLGRMEYAEGHFVIKFYTASGTAGAEVAYDLGATPVTIDLQYAQRFNLASVSEMFAANEKFVHGAADVTAYLNIEQVAKDVYGATWKLDRDGNNNLSISIVDQIAQEKSRAQAAEAALTTALSNESSARSNADQTLQNSIDLLNGTSSVEGSVDNKIKVQVTDKLASTSTGKGASLVAIAPISGLTAGNVQEALQQLKINAGDALVNYKNELANAADGYGASLVAVAASAGFNSTTVEGVLEDHEVRLDRLEGSTSVTGSVDYKIKTQIIDPLASTVSGKGATLVAVQAGSGLNGSNVLAVLVDHESRVDVIEANIAAAGDRAASAHNYFAAKSNFASLDERFEDDEAIVDSNLKRIDDRNTADRTRAVASPNNVFAAGVRTTLAARFVEVETVVDAKSVEVDAARGSKGSLNERLSVSMRADGYLVDDHKIHVHKKYTVTLTANQNKVMLPAGQFYNVNSPTGNGVVLTDSVQIYINGILQANGINFTEIPDANDATKGTGVDFGSEQLVAGDVVIFEWVVNNAN